MMDVGPRAWSAGIAAPVEQRRGIQLPGSRSSMPSKKIFLVKDNAADDPESLRGMVSAVGVGTDREVGLGVVLRISDVPPLCTRPCAGWPPVTTSKATEPPQSQGRYPDAACTTSFDYRALLACMTAWLYA